MVFVVLGLRHRARSCHAFRPGTTKAPKSQCETLPWIDGGAAWRGKLQRPVGRQRERSTLEIHLYRVATAKVDHASVPDVHARPPAMPAASLDGDPLVLAAENHSRGLSPAERAVSDVYSVDYYEEVISTESPLGTGRDAKHRITKGVDVRLRR